MVESAANEVVEEFPGSRLMIGDISAERGGTISGHRSHQSGRDIDIAFFIRDVYQQIVEPQTFFQFNARGRGDPPYQHLTFDAERNWELIEQLMSDPGATVQHIFVARTLETRLIAEAHSQNASDELVHRAATVMSEPQHGHPHRNHFHVRIYCPEDDRPRCRDSGVIHPWHHTTGVVIEETDED